MKISVVIPTYNSAKFITATLESVFRQTAPPDEILVLDDGSTDDTISILSSYRPRITIFQQANRGVASARNELCKRACGDLIAFLDHDDIWHPGYLKTQCELYAKYPDAAAFFVGHVNFHGYDDFRWNEDTSSKLETERIDAISFLKRYNKCPGAFASMSFCCISRTTIKRIGTTPFAVEVSGADDFCLCNHFPLFGPVAYTPSVLVSYRMIEEAQSSNRLKGVEMSVKSFEILYSEYEKHGDSVLMRAFIEAFASKKRTYAKLLMGTGKTAEAKKQLQGSLRLQAGVISFIKSAVLHCLIQLPVSLHPRWPASYREISTDVSD